LEVQSDLIDWILFEWTFGGCVCVCARFACRYGAWGCFYGRWPQHRENNKTFLNWLIFTNVKIFVIGFEVYARLESVYS